MSAHSANPSFPQEYRSRVIGGDKVGRTIGFPTANLDPAILPNNFLPGVYAASVTLPQLEPSKKWTGALYFGPKKLDEVVTTVLEIFLLDFSKDIYGTELVFTPLAFIRPPLTLSTLAEVKAQLTKDVQQVRDTMHSISSPFNPERLV